MNELNIIQRLIGAITEQQVGLAEAGMLRPESDLLKQGLLAGRYQGLQMALDTLRGILSDDEKEQAS